MGLFSGSTIVSRAYSVDSLKTSPELADDLWKNNELRLNAAYLEGGIEEYADTQWHMSKQIRRKYSSDYMNSIGVAVDSSIRVYDFDNAAIETKIRGLLEDPALTVDSVGEPADYAENGTADGLVADIVGDISNIEGTVNDANGDVVVGVNGDPALYRFVYVTGTSKVSQVAVSTDIPSTKVIEVYYYSGTSILVSSGLSSRVVDLSIPYEKLSIDYIKGVMYYEDVLSHLSDYSSNSYWWLGSVDSLAGTLDVGTLEESVTMGSIEDNWLTGTPNDFHVVKTITGSATGKETTVTTSSTTTDGACTGTDSTVVEVEEVLHEGYYATDVEVVESSSVNGVVCTAMYTAVGDMLETITTTTVTTYTSGTRTDDDGNEVETCTEDVEVTVETTYECVGYQIDIDLHVEDVVFNPTTSSSVVPTVSNNYTDYVAVKDYTYGEDDYRFKYLVSNDGISTTYDYYTLPAPDSSIQGIIMSFDAYSSVTEVKRYTGLFDYERVYFSASSMSTIIPPAIPVKCTTGSGNTVTVRLTATSDVYSSSTDYPLTPIIPLKYNGYYYYQRSPVTQAKAYIIRYLDALVTPAYDSSIEEYYATLTVRSVVNQDDIDLKDSIKNNCEGTEDSPVDTVAKLAYVLRESRATDLAVLIDKYEDPVVNSPDSLADAVLTYTDDALNDKTKGVLKVFDTLGVPEDGVDSLMDSVSSSDIYSASVVVGLRLFDSNGNLLTSDTAARAKVMYLFAEMLTGAGTVDGIEKTINIYASSMNANYRYGIVKDTIANFIGSAEYDLALNGGRKRRYLMRVAKEETGSYDSGDRWTSVADSPLYTYVVYVYKLNADGSAVRYKYSEISMTFNSYDGSYTISTKETAYDPASVMISPTVNGGTNLDQLLIIYPDKINRKLSFHEYSILYNDNLFLFTYARKETHVSWYQTSFFGFVLTVAAVAVIIVSQQYYALSGVTGFAITAVAGAALSYGLALAFPGMNPYIRMLLAMALTYGANNVGSGSAGSTTGAATTTITVDTVVNTAVTAIKDYIAEHAWYELAGTAIHFGSMAYQEYMQDKMQDMVAKYSSEIEEIQRKTEEILEENDEYAISEMKLDVFTDYINSRIELESYDPVSIPDWLVTSQFDVDMLEYLSSIDYQRDLADIASLMYSETMIEVDAVTDPSAKLEVL